MWQSMTYIYTLMRFQSVILKEKPKGQIYMNMHQTITCHLGKQGIGSSKHNDRTHITKDTQERIDTSRTQDNYVIISDREASIYDETFRNAMDEYNAKAIKQGHPERVKNMEDYKMENTYEMIFQIGNANTLSVNDCDRNDKIIINDIMEQAVFMMQRTYPQLKITQAVVHWDETSPHMHVRYVGVAEHVKRGMHTQANRKKAFEQMGFRGKDGTCREDNATTEFTKHIQEEFIKIATNNGIIKEASARGKDNPNMSVNQYKEWCKANEYIKQAKEKAQGIEKSALEAELKAKDAVNKFNKVNEAFKKEFDAHIHNGEFESLAKANAKEDIKRALHRGDFNR